MILAPKQKQLADMTSTNNKTEGLELAAILKAQIKPISKEEQLRISKIDQHDPTTLEATPEWLASRLIDVDFTYNQQAYHAKLKRITGSVVGSIFGVNKYSSPTQALKDFLWPSFTGNAATFYGNKMEDTCQQMFIETMYEEMIDSDHHDVYGTLRDVRIDNTGLIIDRDNPMFGMSPDGILIKEYVNFYSGEKTELRSLIEYKCPYSKRTLKDIAKKQRNIYPVQSVAKTSLFLPVPSYYYSQVQFGLFVLERNGFINRTDAYFVVYVPNQQATLEILSQNRSTNFEQTSKLYSSMSGSLQVTKIKKNQAYIDQMLSHVTDWYNNEYLPSAAFKAIGTLKQNELSMNNLIEFFF
jgi:hypothetical protein